jgi:hypothetical protein
LRGKVFGFWTLAFEDAKILLDIKDQKPKAQGQSPKTKDLFSK